ncbi:hypothetical protein MAJ_08667, partial [Metarhizium majus ARSEF 297]
MASARSGKVAVQALADYGSRMKPLYTYPNGSYGPDPDPLFVKGVETTSLRLENLRLFPVFAQEPESHVDEMQSSYKTMILESRRVTNFVNDFIDTMNEQDSQLVPVGGSCAASQSLLCFLRLAEPDNSSLFEDADFLSAECLKAARRSCKFKPLGASLTPLALGVAWASTAHMAEQGEAAKLLDEFKDDLLGSKFIKLAVQLEARYRRLGQKLGYPRDDEPVLSESQGNSSVASSSPTWIGASKGSGDAAGCSLM